MSLYIFDKDLTLVGSTTGRTADTLEDQFFLPNVLEVCTRLRADGHVLAIASNQGGVAFGVISPETARLLVSDVAGKIKAADFEVCFHHPGGRIAPWNTESPNRKPFPGMILALMERLGFAPEDTVYIGDNESDRKAAEAAGVEFVDADEFFLRGKSCEGVPASGHAGR